MENKQMEVLNDLNVEMLLIGALYNRPSLIEKYGEHIKPDTDFYHDITRLLFNALYTVYHKDEAKNITQAKIELYMDDLEERRSLYLKSDGYEMVKRLQSMADTDDICNYFDDVRKVAYLRALDAKGFPARKIYEKPVFNRLNSLDIFTTLAYTLETLAQSVGLDYELERFAIKRYRKWHMVTVSSTPLGYVATLHKHSYHEPNNEVQVEIIEQSHNKDKIIEFAKAYANLKDAEFFDLTEGK